MLVYLPFILSLTPLILLGWGLQVSCARVLEIGVLEALQEPNRDSTPHNRCTVKNGDILGLGDVYPSSPDSKQMVRLPALAEDKEDSSSPIISMSTENLSKSSYPVRERKNENKEIVEDGMFCSASSKIMVVLRDWFWFLVGVCSWMACLAVRCLEARVVWTPFGEET